MHDGRIQRGIGKRTHRASEATVLVPHHARVLSPVALRPVVKPPRPRHSLVDRLLLLGEWTAALLLVGFGGYQVYDGPVRDWLYTSSTTAAPATVQVVPAVQPAPMVAEQAPATASIAEPQTADEAATARMLHPELGYALPSIGEKWRRPAVAPDYLQPAREFVPAALPAPAVVEVAAPAAPVPAMAADPRPTRVHAPVVGIDTGIQEVFLQDGVWQVADYAAGYLDGTGVPGTGNVVMAGHAGIRGAVFATLQSLKPGDDVFVDTATQRFRYRVRETGNVWPSQVSVLFPTTKPILTLITCTNWDMQRFVVIADLIETAALPESAG